MSRKRYREPPAADTQLVEIYEDLANLDETIRLKAAHALITNFVAGREADDNHSKRLDSILRRLIQGLCSSRKAARIGFSIALTELLTSLSESTKQDVPSFQDASTLLKTLRQRTTATTGVSGQEERDYCLGRLFGVEAIIRAGVLFHDAGNSSPWAEAIDVVLQLASKKTWLREQCGYMLYATLQGSSLPRDEPWYATLILDKLRSHGLAKTAEGVALWLAVLSKYPEATTPIGVWHQGDPLCHRERTLLAQILREAPSSITSYDESQRAIQTGHWNAKLHFAWHVVLSQILSTSQAKAKGNGNSFSRRIYFEEFWVDCVDRLFTASSSQERKYWGFLLFQQMIAQGPPQIITCIFSQNFMHCFINHLALPDRYLHRAADHTRRALIDKCKSDPSTVASILKSLIAPPRGVIDFDGRTKTKTVEVILARAALKLPRDTILLYRSLILQPATEDDKLAAFRRKLLVDQLINVLRSSQGDAATQGESLVLNREMLSLFAKLAYYDLNAASDGESQRPIPAISPGTRSVCKACISSCFSCTMKDLGVSASLAYGLICDIHQENGSDGWGDLLLEADVNIKALLDKALATLSYLQNEDHGTDSATQKFRQSVSILMSMSLLQLHNGDVDAFNVLEELNELFAPEVLECRGKETKRDYTALVGIFLSLVSKPSLLLRRLTQQVFTAFAADIDSAGLSSMIKVIETKENIAGQAEIFQEENDEMDITDASDIKDTNSSSDGSSSSLGIEREVSKDSGESDKSDITMSSQTEEFDQEVAIFDAKLAQALGTRPSQEDVDAIDSSSEEDMNDQQMEELDEHLESMFRERKNRAKKKREQKDAKETIISFKCRVLELLDVYIKQEHANILAMDLLLPMLLLIRTTSSPILSRKSCDFIRTYFRLCKGSGLVKIRKPDLVMDKLRSIHDEAGRESSKAHAVACSQASLLLVRILVSFDRECLRDIVAVYANTQERVLFEPNFKVKIAFFMDWSNWCNNAKV